MVLDIVSSQLSTRTRILDAALLLLSQRDGADVTMAEIASAAGVSRQAVYLHFGDRPKLLTALVRHADEQRGLASQIAKVTGAPSGITAVAEMVSLQARMNPSIWAVARALDAVRRVDKDAEQAWQDRLQNRLNGCRGIIGRLAQEGSLRPGLDAETATDLLWTVTSLRTWEDLVLERGWSSQQYQSTLTEMLLTSLTTASDPEAGGSIGP
jgi:AcrR family transcriptional regulator